MCKDSSQQCKVLPSGRNRRTSAVAGEHLQLHDFHGEQLHFIQIGFGNNTTFVQNLAGPDDCWSRQVDWLLSACSEMRPEDARGLAVEPVRHHFRAMRRLALQHLRQVQLLQAALGEGPEAGEETEIFVLQDSDELLALLPRGRRRRRLRWQFSFLENMSCVGREHPEFESMCRWIQERYGLRPKMIPERVEKWSWATLARQLNFSGCQVLLIDAEGHDASILRSMLDHCEGRPDEFPEVIQFETRGHCDRVEGSSSELQIIDALQDAGYLLLSFSHADTHLVLRSAFQRRRRLRRWASAWACTTCWRKSRFPYYSCGWHGTYCSPCWESWERGRERS